MHKLYRTLNSGYTSLFFYALQQDHDHRRFLHRPNSTTTRAIYYAERRTKAHRKTLWGMQGVFHATR
ncbi:hypothetical protein A0H81_07125 [Grifola frondosa]|uniref:Uncharacterized protein n=1 Tax=Grifola frondosa TaxID=5627 RepID=A0A1C7M817_GRIFR|nr:hypothetical protein A0H81_07125 [Grifola frondosa]